jgi:hypothetical protein
MFRTEHLHLHICQHVFTTGYPVQNGPCPGRICTHLLIFVHICSKRTIPSWTEPVQDEFVPTYTYLYIFITLPPAIPLTPQPHPPCDPQSSLLIQSRLREGVRLIISRFADALKTCRRNIFICNVSFCWRLKDVQTQSILLEINTISIKGRRSWGLSASFRWRLKDVQT